MKPTEDLKNEHAAVKLALKILEETARRLEEGVSVEEDHLGGLLEFLRVFVDRCHHGKEEDLLFPAMERAGVPREGGPLGVMLAEHKEGRMYVKGMGAAFLEYRKGGRTSGREYAQNARGYPSWPAISKRRTTSSIPWPRAGCRPGSGRSWKRALRRSRTRSSERAATRNSTPSFTA